MIQHFPNDCNSNLSRRAIFGPGFSLSNRSGSDGLRWFHPHNTHCFWAMISVIAPNSRVSAPYPVYDAAHVNN